MLEFRVRISPIVNRMTSAAVLVALGSLLVTFAGVVFDIDAIAWLGFGAFGAIVLLLILAKGDLDG